MHMHMRIVVFGSATGRKYVVKSREVVRLSGRNTNVGRQPTPRSV